MKRPVIGLAAALLPYPESATAFHCARQYANDTYVKSIIKAGGNPILLLPSDDIETSVSLVDGILLMGGHDIDPSVYGEEKMECCKACDLTEDRFQLDVFFEAQKQNKPILGICRGHQLINVALGGTLYQDYRQREGTREDHLDERQYDCASHEIVIKEGSILHHLMGRTRVGVNSLHHQSVKDIGKGLEATAWTEDGSIEALEGKDILTVQFHPESMVMRSDEMLPVFTWLIEKASNSR